MNRENSRKTDLSVGQALAISLGLLIGFLALTHHHEVKFYYNLLEFLGSHYEQVLWIQGAALALNFLAIGAVLSRLLEQVQQGSKLKELAQKKTAHPKALLIQAGVSICAGLAVIAYLWWTQYPIELRGYEEFTDIRFLDGVRLNLAFAAQVLAFVMTRLFLKIPPKLKSKIPPMPEGKNEIVLGTVGEEEGNPEWAILTEKSLYGGILNTSSVGGGKTESLIKPSLDQLLCKFDPRPAFLIIDPKSSIPKDVIQIVEKAGLSDHFLHMHLDGNVTFNPLYMEKALTRARFADIAQMISAAQVNFTGIGRKEDFWESSSSNLVKNAIIYCAATQEYFTFNSVYQVISESINADEKLCNDLRECLESEKFDTEEKHNIRACLNYFEKEFSQFDIKVKTGIFATATSFLNQFQEYQASRIFCAKKEDLTLTSMDQVIDEGKILLFDINNPGLARAMGTFIKLHYQLSNLRRIGNPKRPIHRPAVLLIDEYQDVVSTGAGKVVGDNTYSAKSREAKAINIVSTQSVSSIENAVGNDKATKELLQNFRTRIAGHSTDLPTIKLFQELCGQESQEKITHSFSEQSQRPTKNLIFGGFDSKESNISESISKSEQKEYIIKPQDFAKLKTFECFAQIYDGVETQFKRLYLKPYYLKDKSTSQEEIWKSLGSPTIEKKSSVPKEGRQLGKAVATWVSLVKILILICMGALDGSFSFPTAHAEILFPNICSVIRSNEFFSCFKPSIGAPCMCGFPPRPCLTVSYYVPKYFVEVQQTPGSTFFNKYPEAIGQLATVSALDSAGVDSEDSHFYQAHIIPVPLLREMLEASRILPCGTGTKMGCFRAMSEHLGGDWTHGSKDDLQPSFKMWTLAGGTGIKACLLKGAIDSFSTAADSVKSIIPFSMDEDLALACSNPAFSIPPIYPPSRHGACNGWGTFYPRSGVYDGANHVLGALQVAARLRSLASDVYKTMSESDDEYWQIIKPQNSSCFREGEGMLKQLEFHEASRIKDLNYKDGYLFALWQKASCCADIHEFPKIIATVELALKAACLGVGL